MRGRAVFALALLTMLVGCTAAPAPGGSTSPGGGTTSSGEAQRKAISIAVITDINTLSGTFNSSGIVALPTQYMHQFFTGFITLHNERDEIVPSLAAELPSVERGTWKILDDGRMEVTWKIRPGIKWHDGRDFTADDVKFAWEAAVDPLTPYMGPAQVPRSWERVEAPDPHTVVIQWRTTSRFGGELGRSELYPLPRHVLEAAFQNEKETFINHPYFATAEGYVGAGPYRTVEWLRGSHLTLEAFDGYFQGKPRIDRVTFRFITDPRTMMVNMLSGSLDLIYHGIGYEEARTIREEWAKRDGGVVFLEPNNLRAHLPQMRPEMAQPLDLATDARVRKALLYGLNRESIVEGEFPGLQGLVADSGAVPGTPEGEAVARQVVRYPYDPNRATQLLRDAGWSAGGDGMLSKGGTRFQLDLRGIGFPEFDTVLALMQQDYRQLGIELQATPIVGGNPADQAIYPGLLMTGVPANTKNFSARWLTRNIATERNRWSTTNRSGYSNAELDRLSDELDRTIREADQPRYWGEMWRILTDEVGVMPLFFAPVAYIVRTGVVGPVASHVTPPPAYNLHQWDLR
jgi:peptide/nickel transport system substrate-binding protein